jgi:hypothetical protein
MPLSVRRVLRTFRYAMYFNGVNSYVFVSRSSSLEPSQLTVSVWANMNSLISRDWGPMFVSKYNGKYQGYTLFLIGTSGRPTFRIATPNVFYEAISPVAITMNSWYFITGVWDGSNIYIYVNSVLKNRASAPAITHSADLYIGREGWAPYGYVNGFIFQVLIYSRALSDSEIQWNYQYPDNPVRSGLVLWLQAHPDYIKDIDGDGVLEWVDLSGYGNHGKIYGAQLVELVKAVKRVLTPARVLKAVR